MVDQETESPAQALEKEGQDASSRCGSAVATTLIKAGATVIVAGIGLLGPVTTAIVKLYEIQLDERKFSAQMEVERLRNQGAKEIQEATLKHQTEMDFLAKLIDVRDFQTNDEKKTIFRRDVLKFFKATLPPGQLADLASTELTSAEEEMQRISELKRALEKKQEELVQARAAGDTKARQLATQVESLRARLGQRSPEFESARTVEAMANVDRVFEESRKAECAKCATAACRRAWCKSTE